MWLHAEVQAFFPRERSERNPLKISMVLLAAGNSRRFGSNKLLYSIDGVTMFERAFKTLKMVQMHFSDISLTVVTQYREIVDLARMEGAVTVINPHPEQGISSSLKLGLEAVPEADVTMFAVSDQPGLSASTVIYFLEEFLKSGKAGGCLCFGERTGNPCVFSTSLYPELRALCGDRGGKKVLLAHPENVFFYSVSSEEELRDLDIPQNDS